MDFLNTRYSETLEKYFNTLALTFINFCSTFGPLNDISSMNVPSNPIDQFHQSAGFSPVIRFLFLHLSSPHCVHGCGLCQAAQLNPVSEHCTRTCLYCSRHFSRSRRPYNSSSHYCAPHGLRAVQLMTVRSTCNLFHRVLSITVDNAATLRLQSDLLYLLRINIYPNCHPARRKLLNKYLNH